MKRQRDLHAEFGYNGTRMPPVVSRKEDVSPPAGVSAVTATATNRCSSEGCKKNRTKSANERCCCCASKSACVVAW